MTKDQAIHNLCPTTGICKNIDFNIDFEEILFANLAEIFQEIVFKTHYKESGNTLTCTIDIVGFVQFCTVLFGLYFKGRGDICK